jgi:hypothetical protein
VNVIAILEETSFLDNVFRNELKRSDNISTTAGKDVSLRSAVSFT